MLAQQVDSLDAIPENARGAYVAKDGKFVLDADIPDTTGLKSKNSELIGKLTAAQKRAALLGDRADDEITADLELAKQTREKKAKDEGDFESLKTQLLTQHKAELEKAGSRVSKVEGKLYDVLGKREAESAITAAGGKAKVLLPHVLPFIKVVEEADEFSAVVVDAKGKPRIADGQATPMTIAQLVEQFKADPEFADNFAASGAAGGNARNSGTTAGASGMVVIPKGADVQTYRRMKDDAVKRGVPYQVGA